MPTPPSNPRLPQIGATLFGLFALGFVVATLVHLGHDGGGLDDPAMVLAYAASPVPFLVVGALACLMVRPETYRTWMAAFGALVLLWMVGGVVAMVGVGGDDAVVVFLHLAVAAAGATTVFLVRGVARQRGLST
jgi:hypothetical protein